MQIKATLICCAIFCLGLIDLIQADGETAPVQAATTPSPSNDEIDLDSMTNEELEEICTSRGFEVVKEKDGDTGEMKTYSHEDYINAARQCLEIESEMDEILSENPELIEEIEAEAERMRQENERLEQKISSMIDENGNEDASEENASTDKNQQTIEVEDDSDEVIDLDKGNDTKSNEKPTTGDSSTKVVAPDEDTPDLSFGAITREVKAKILEDFHRVADLIVPKSARGPLKEAMEPIVRVARDSTKTVVDMVKRYASQFFTKSKDGEEANQAAVATK